MTGSVVEHIYVMSGRTWLLRAAEGLESHVRPRDASGAPRGFGSRGIGWPHSLFGMGG